MLYAVQTKNVYSYNTDIVVAKTTFLVGIANIDGDVMLSW
jgi:hypothetical protein